MIGRPGRSLTRRLIWLASGWILVALILTGWVLTSQFEEASLRRLSVTLNDTLDEVIVATRVVDGELNTQPIQDAKTLRIYSGKYWATAEPAAGDQLVLRARSRSLWDARMPIPPSLGGRLRAAFGQAVTYNATGPAGEPIRVAATMNELEGRDQPVVFMAAIDRTDVDADARQFATLTWVALLVLGVGLVLAVLIQVQIGLRPLYGLRNEIIAVRKGQSARIERSYPLEIQPLAEQVNGLMDHNQEVVERQRTHVGNLAHALKTPLSVMLAEAGSSEGQLPDLVRRQTEVMKAQVDHHLRRARAAARAQVLGERTAIAEVLDEMAVMLERVFADKGVVIDWRAPDELGFRGERQDLQEILGNLLENACKWSKRRVRVSAGASGLGQMIVVVEDDGPGVAAERRAEVLKRGARADEDTPGSGLGLAIVDDLTRAYGGRLNLADSDLGGLKVMLELPAAE
ncbi:histidine kinase [Brevundimonas sp. Leaf363]|nr:sensor histidine kinase [Brevundimonas sp. Leaf363]KQS56508.1 histidine kinase [Brevundimonas sp. Leaf363]